MLNESVIPIGSYCYTIDRIEYNADTSIPPSIKINLCPYWKYMDIETDEPHCSYCDMMGIHYDSILIGDQCKVCGVNEGDEWLELE